MRLPAQALTAAFACGMVIGLHPAVVRNAAPLILRSSSLVTIVVLLLATILLAQARASGRAFCSPGTLSCCETLNRV